MARMAIQPSVNAAAVIDDFSAASLGKQDFAALMDVLAEEVKDVWAGDMRRPEAMLYGQAQALQAIFVNLARRSGVNIGEHMDATERYMRLALKAQGQCRATLETLAAVKNPPVAFARQANFSGGSAQQINNGPALRAGVSATAQSAAPAAQGVGDLESLPALADRTTSSATQTIFTSAADIQTSVPVGERVRVLDCRATPRTRCCLPTHRA